MLWTYRQEHQTFIWNCKFCLEPHFGHVFLPHISFIFVLSICPLFCRGFQQSWMLPRIQWVQVYCYNNNNKRDIRFIIQVVSLDMDLIFSIAKKIELAHVWHIHVMQFKSIKIDESTWLATHVADWVRSYIDIVGSVAYYWLTYAHIVTAIINRCKIIAVFSVLFSFFCSFVLLSQFTSRMSSFFLCFPFPRLSSFLSTWHAGLLGIPLSK